ncbi:sensor histidine kinase [Labedella endophytica]|uniref:Histidine kinase n=1 Tax=Labedella endophytica TaxID=1523160 RepID=A0A433JSI4_9MICO|nr:ATP-binding protein [Labedella endophytica]RUR01276.1 histidine kinase [Labedella endophytica]
MSGWRGDDASEPVRRQFESIDRFSIQQSRLAYRMARSFGFTGVLGAAIALLIPGAVDGAALVWCYLTLALLAASHVVIARYPHGLSVVAVYAVGIICLATVGIAAGPEPSPSASAAIVMIAGWGVGSIGAVLSSTWAQVILLVYSIATTVTIATLLGADIGHEVALSAPVLVGLGWAVTTIFGLWLTRANPRVMNRISSIGATYLIERRASEAEAQRHRDARLLHDTALATLTLLAHAGRGVDDAAMRDQAASDRDLLRRLREGESPTPRSSGAYTLTHTAELQLSGTLEAVKARFAHSGLEVAWHGSGQLGLEQSRLDAFILALTECIENVRRHAGVDEAHVTLSDDGTVVRGVVTDAGIGFDPASIAGSSLGFQQSVIARTQDIGGTVRVFSAPGAGTTVVLEVPK